MTVRTMTTDSPPAISLSKPDLSDKERAYLLDAFDSTWVSSLGPYVARFERGFADFVGVDHGISCVNGTAALHLALLGLGIGAGDEVILPDLTYVATANAVRYVGATPVLADIHADTWTIDTASVERLITPRTRAMIAVHLFGVPCDLAALSDLSTRYCLSLIEDTSQAHGARYGGRAVGSWGDVSTFSFYGNKIVTTGEGGMVCTNDGALAARMRSLRGQGVDPNHAYWFTETGYNYRLTNLACALGLAQLERFEALRHKREAVRAWYERMIQDADAPLEIQRATPQTQAVLWMFGVLLARDAPVSRDEARRRLADSGIETRPFFHPIHTLPMFADARTDQGCPVCADLAGRGLMLPTHTGLTPQDVQRVVDMLTTSILQTAGTP